MDRAKLQISDSGQAEALAWLQRHSVAVFLILVLIGSLRIVATYTVFSHTYDEPAHLACGIQWLQQGIYRYEPQHPPLARVAMAIGPTLAGSIYHSKNLKWFEGLAILYADGHYNRTLALARLGILPFFWIATLVVYLWAIKYLGEPCAALAVLIFTSLPPVLAHAGLATTDMAVTAMTGASFLSAVNWIEKPTPFKGLIFGLALGMAVLSKFSALAFIPVSLVVALGVFILLEGGSAVMRLSREHLRTFCLGLLTAFYTVWAGYRFSFGHVPFTALRLPFPELLVGIHDVVEHNRHGGAYAYLFGEHRDSGWWYYYFVAMGVKTPLAFFPLLACGMASVGRKEIPRGVWLALAFSGGILLFSLFSRINLGLRHILVVYIGFSIIAGAGAAALVERAKQWQPAGWIVGALLLSMVSSSVMAHPDYLAYFNVLAGSEPERILVDSDLDWGQDMKRLVARLRQIDAPGIAFTTYYPVDAQAQGLPPVTPFDLWHAHPGWNVASITELKLMLAGKNADHPELHFWTESVSPTEKVGSSYWLWYIGPDGKPAPPPTAAVAGGIGGMQPPGQ